MATVQDLVDDILNEGAFDVTSAQALRWLDRRHKSMCARARVYRKTTDFGPTVIGQQEYGLGAGLIEALDVTVDGAPYTRARHTDIAQNAGGWLTLSGMGGVFADSASSAGVQQLVLIPAPTEAGLAVSVYGVFLPATLELDNAPGLLIDEDLVEGLLAGVFATGLSRPQEARLDLAQSYEAQFSAACEEQRRRVGRRLKGAGPSQIRLVDVNA